MRIFTNLNVENQYGFYESSYRESGNAYIQCKGSILSVEGTCQHILTTFIASSHGSYSASTSAQCSAPLLFGAETFGITSGQKFYTLLLTLLMTHLQVARQLVPPLYNKILTPIMSLISKYWRAYYPTRGQQFIPKASGRLQRLHKLPTYLQPLLHYTFEI